jgi:Fe-S-cluster containining protein
MVRLLAEVQVGRPDYREHLPTQNPEAPAFATSADTEDVDRWEREGRFDILEWVDLSLRDLGMMDLWLDPTTGDEATRCPWLRKVPRQDRYVCRIHDTKPRHCREYPKSKKHASMTGCPGFSS